MKKAGNWNTTAEDRQGMEDPRRSLEKRRIYIDMLHTFKIIHGFDDVRSETWFNIVG